MVFLDGEFIDKWTYIRTFDFILSKDSSVSFDSNFFISSNIISNITNGVILENNLNKSILYTINQTLLQILNLPGKFVIMKIRVQLIRSREQSQYQTLKLNLK